MNFRKNASRVVFTFMAIICIAFHPAYSSKKKDKKEETSKTAESKDALKSISEVTKKCKKTEGLFTLFQDSVAGTSYLLIKKDQIGKEYIYFCYTADGVLAAGHFRGAYLDREIFSIKKYFNKIEFITQNTSFYFDKNNAVSKASEANISNATMVSQALVAEDKIKGEYLIKADDVFLTEALHQVKPSPPSTPVPGASVFSLGTLNKEKTKYVSMKSYPMNTDIVVEYIYDNTAPTVRGGNDLADDRYVSIKVQHSFIEVPKNNFKPRYDDPRMGYFIEQVNDMTSTSATPYKDLIHRWNLEKKDKNAVLSEPIEPITWWIENTTPVEYRETIKNAALEWNEAFEAAGFKNAVAVKIQPDDADWDAGDIRYNVLRWTSSPTPPFGGYGPSFVNPRTGQILGADIMLEYVFITNNIRLEKLIEAGTLNAEDDLLQQPENYCSLGDYLHQSALFGVQQLKANDATTEEISEFIKSSLYYLVLHEMGHTFGLNHNMKSSQLYSPLEINNKELTSKTGLIGSVMDYPAANISLDKSKQGQYFTTKPGPYDKWAVEYGYSQAIDNEQEEQKRLQAILSRSTEPALAFGNDADDMRFPGRGIDPRVMIGDMSSDAITYSIDRIKLAESLAAKVKDKYSIPNQSYHELKNAYTILVNQQAVASGVISRYIGGIYVDRAFVGQQNASKPYTPVSYKDQKRAMDALSAYLFGIKAFQSQASLYAYLQTQRRGFEFSSSNEDPKIHEGVLNIQKNVLTQLLHPDVLKRITNSELYGNEYKLPEFMNDLTNAVFKDDLTASVNTFRQNLQTEYLVRLTEIVNNIGAKYDYRSQSNAFGQLKTIEKMLAANPGIDSNTKNHRQLLAFKINKALEVK